MTRATGDAGEFERWRRQQDTLARMATRVAPTLTEPLPSRGRLRSLVGDDQAWTGVFERPLAEWLEHGLATDVMRGVALTDATIGTFAARRRPGAAPEPVLPLPRGRADRSVEGARRRDGRADRTLAAAAERAGAEIRTGVEVVSVSADDGGPHEVDCRRGADRGRGTCWPTSLRRCWRGSWGTRTSRRRTGGIAAEDQHGAAPAAARCATRGHGRARRSPAPSTSTRATSSCSAPTSRRRRGQIPSAAPVRAVLPLADRPDRSCPPELHAAGVQTLTLFGLHMPARLFRADPDGAKQAAVAGHPGLGRLGAGRAARGLPAQRAPTASRAWRRSPRSSSRPSWRCPAATSSTAT